MESDKQLKGSDDERDWANMDQDMLLKIFMTLNIVDLMMRISGVCRSWCAVCHDPFVWSTINMDKMIDSFSEFYDCEFLDDDIMPILEKVLTWSRGTVTTFICNTHLELDFSEWVFLADRTTRLEKLVLPLPEPSMYFGFREAAKRWYSLTTLTTAGVTDWKPYLKAISEYCPSFSKLKHMGIITPDYAELLVAYLPKLKVLSLRGSFIIKEALDTIVEKLEDLETLNLSHCLVKGFSPQPSSWTSFPEVDHQRLKKKAGKINRLTICIEKSCPNCLNSLSHCNAISFWFDFDGGFWKEDEVSVFTG